MRSDVRYSKQSTLGNATELPKKDSAKSVLPELKKRIEIIEIVTSTREDELAFKIGFRLLPSRTSFSRVASDLFFDGQKINSLRLRIVQGPLASDDLEFSSVLDMTGIGEGRHLLTVEMCELWSSGEKLTCVSKEVTIEYIPLKRSERLVLVPIIKSVAGADLAIVSESEKNIYREMDENMKREIISKRDEW
jgi:hypothetical protein